MKSALARFLEDQSGATAVEYGLIALFIGVGIVIGLIAVRNSLDGVFMDVASDMAL